MRSGDAGENFGVDLEAAFGVAANGYLRPASFFCGVESESIGRGRVFNLITLLSTVPSSSVTRLWVERNIRLFPARREHSLFG